MVNKESAGTAGYELRFGKHRGVKLNEVPLTYLKFLLAYRPELVEGKLEMRDDVVKDSSLWLWQNQEDAIEKARGYVKEQRLCVDCLKPLVAIGEGRKNGKSHPDWEERQLHKHCFRKLAA